MKEQYYQVYNEQGSIVSDASAEGMQKVGENLERTIKVQEDFWKSRCTQDKLGIFN